jgi:hypothetical protein
MILATLRVRTTGKNARERPPAWYLLGLNEGHGFAKKENQDFDFYTTIMFIQKYLLD